MYHLDIFNRASVSPTKDVQDPGISAHCKAVVPFQGLRGVPGAWQVHCQWHASCVLNLGEHHDTCAEEKAQINVTYTSYQK